ncbi:MAG TPA: hypothetical protein VF179_33420 [Thermoanaerobaculia bacterium]|nr:hypothetical protein [Thermoanaerobaculia bacterium]
MDEELNTGGQIEGGQTLPPLGSAAADATTEAAEKTKPIDAGAAPAESATEPPPEERSAVATPVDGPAMPKPADTTNPVVPEAVRGSVRPAPASTAGNEKGAEQPQPGTSNRSAGREQVRKTEEEKGKKARSPKQRNAIPSLKEFVNEFANLRDSFSVKKAGKFVINNLGGVPPKDVKEFLQEEEEEDLGLLDVTEAIHADSIPAFPPNPEELHAWVESLRAKRVLLLCSPDLGVLDAAGEAVVAGFASLERRVLRMRERGQTALNCDALLRRRAGDPSPCLILVEATEAHSAPFLDSVVRSRSTLRAVCGSLSAAGRFLLVLTTDAILGWRDRLDDVEREYVPRRSVPFLAPRLQRSFPSRWQDLAGEIARQRESGRWGTNEEGFYRQFLDSLAGGTLEREVERRRGTVVPGDLDAAKEAHASQLLESGAELDVCSLFLAAFFPGLPVSDFERVLVCLVDGLSEEIRKTEYLLTAEGVGIEKQVSTFKPLAEIWRERRSEILRRCHLRVQSAASSPGGRSVPRAPAVEFALPYLFDDTRVSFLGEHFMIYLDLVGRIRAQGLVFDACPEVCEGAVRLVVDLAERVPSEQRLRELLATISRERRERPEVFEGLYQLVRALLQSTHLRSASDVIFRELLAAGFSTEVPRIATSLHGVGGFDSYSWLRRLLDEGNIEARTRTYLYLLHMLQRGGAETADLLTRISAWLPDRKASPAAGISNSSTGALSLLLDVAQVLLADPRPRTGVWPPGDPLLAALTGASDSQLEPVIVPWLLHPACTPLLKDHLPFHLLLWTVNWLIPPVLRPVASQLIDDLQGTLEDRWGPALDQAEREAGLWRVDTPWGAVFPSMVLADWAVQLLAAGDPEPPAEARQVFERILDQTVAVSGPFERRALAIFWSTLEESVLDVLLILNKFAPGSLDSTALASVRQDLHRRACALRQLRSELSTRERSRTSHTQGESSDARPSS